MPIKMHVILSILAIGSATQCGLQAIAQDKGGSFSMSVQNAASELEQLQIALQSPDASTRYAAFTRAIESGRVDMREVAISVGLSSADEPLQQMAIRAGFMGISLIAPSLDEPGERIRQTYVNLAIETYDWRAGVINQSSTRANGRGYGTVDGAKIVYISDAGCTVDIKRQVGTWIFVGNATCELFDNPYYNEYHAKLSYKMR